MHKYFLCILLTLITSLFALVAVSSESVDGRNINKFYSKSVEFQEGEFLKWVFNLSEIKRSYALVIGIGDYTSKGFKRLESPYHDAIRVKNFLLNEAGFDGVHLLTNSAATKQQISKLLVETFPNMLTKHDRFLFYFSGHGTQRNISGKPRGYLVLANSGRHEYSEMLDMSDIDKWDDLLRETRHVLFVLDACFSGLAGYQIKSDLEDKQLRRLSKYAHHLITAGTANQQSVASLTRWEGSLFTDAFIRGASGAADTANSDFGIDGIVSLKELMDYIGKQIDKESLQERSIKMSPQLSYLEHSEGEFFFIDPTKKEAPRGKSLDEYNSLSFVNNENDVAQLIQRQKQEIQRLERLNKLLQDESIRPKGQKNNDEQDPNTLPDIQASPSQISTSLPDMEESFQSISSVILRDTPSELSEEDVVQMFQQKGLAHPADFSHSYLPGSTRGMIRHEYETYVQNGDTIIVDYATNLIWQQSGSSKHMKKERIEDYRNETNSMEYAGFDDWRIPTLEELASLLESDLNQDDLYINPLFDSTQQWCWSADSTEGTQGGWIVNFASGGVAFYLDGRGKKAKVRLVRSRY